MIGWTNLAVSDGLFYGATGLLLAAACWISSTVGRIAAKPEVAFRNVEDTFSVTRRIYFYALLLPQALIVAFFIGFGTGSAQAPCHDWTLDLLLTCDGRVSRFITILLFHYALSVYGATPVIEEYSAFLADNGNSEDAIKEWKALPQTLRYPTWRPAKRKE
jgi:hypothetical protein